MAPRLSRRTETAHPRQDVRAFGRGHPIGARAQQPPHGFRSINGQALKSGQSLSKPIRDEDRLSEMQDRVRAGPGRIGERRAYGALRAVSEPVVCGSAEGGSARLPATAELCTRPGPPADSRERRHGGRFPRHRCGARGYGGACRSGRTVSPTASRHTCGACCCGGCPTASGGRKSERHHPAGRRVRH